MAEQILRGGIPAVRQALEKQNAQARAEGRPEVRSDAVLALAEQLVPKLRAAEWRDRADAAIAGIDELDLRDLRSVVVAADDVARDEPSRELAARVREGLSRRIDQEHQRWLGELTELLNEGRVVRALRLSSRPPKAGAPLPADLTSRLAEAATAALTVDAAQDRWAALLDALSFSPVRRQVQPEQVPAEPGEELLAVVQKVAGRLPEIAARFGVEAAASPPPARVGPRAPRRQSPARKTDVPASTQQVGAEAGEGAATRVESVPATAPGTGQHPPAGVAAQGQSPGKDEDAGRPQPERPEADHPEPQRPESPRAHEVARH